LLKKSEKLPPISLIIYLIKEYTDFSGGFDIYFDFLVKSEDGS